MVISSKTNLTFCLLSRFFSSTHGLRLDRGCSSTRPSRYYGNAIWAYQDLKPKDILDNNTIAAQPGYLRDLDLRGEIWGGCRLRE